MPPFEALKIDADYMAVMPEMRTSGCSADLFCPVNCLPRI